MNSLFTKWSWKGFFIRYSIILIILVAINFYLNNRENDEAKNTYQTQSHQPTLEVSHTVEGNNINFQFKVEHFDLSFENVSKEKVHGQGHIHLYLDGEKVAKVYDEQYVLKNVPQGTHDIKIELAHNDHESLGVVKNLKIEIK